MTQSAPSSSPPLAPPFPPLAPPFPPPFQPLWVRHPGIGGLVATGMPGPNYAGFWARVGAYWLDSLIFLPLSWIALVVLLATNQGIINTSGRPIISPTPGGIFLQFPTLLPIVGVFSLISGAISGAYFYYFFKHGQTLGMKAIGLEVVRAEDGGLLDSERALKRSAFFFLPATLGFIPGIGSLISLMQLISFVWVGFDSRKQGLHDQFAKTIVISGRVKPGMKPFTAALLWFSCMALYAAIVMVILVSMTRVF